MKSKREAVIYVVIAMWIYLGSLGIYMDTSLSELAAYFLALTGFVSSYIWAETKRHSGSTSWWKKGKNSKREVMIYLTILLWGCLGSYGIIEKADILDLSAYYAALTPFISSWLIGETVKSHNLESTEITEDQPINS